MDAKALCPVATPFDETAGFSIIKLMGEIPTYFLYMAKKILCTVTEISDQKLILSYQTKLETTQPLF
jgi:hypothetical protein